MTKTILITGATSGIGSFLSQHFGAKGHKLFLHGRSAKKLKELSGKLGDKGHTVLIGDYTDADSLDKMFDVLSEQTKSLDVLINNAFGKLEADLSKTNAESLSEFFQVSVAGTADVTRRCLPFLKRSGSGRVVNIVADWGFPMHNVMTGPSAYIAGKYAVHGLGAALQTELGKLGIRVTNVCPGIVAADTQFGIDDAGFSKANGNKAIHPGDLANAIDFILAQDFSHIRSIVLTPPNPDYNGL